MDPVDPTVPEFAPVPTAPATTPAESPYTVLKEVTCECGQPIIALQAPDKSVTVMHKKPACRAWEQKRTAAFNAYNAERLRRRGRGMTQPQSMQAANRHARRRAEALARRGVKP